MDSAFNQALKMFGNTLGGVSNFIGNEVQQVTPQVGNFLKSATNSLTPMNSPLAQQQQTAQGMGNFMQAAAKPLQNFVQQAPQAVGNYFNPQQAAQGQNFWNTDLAKGLGQFQQGAQALGENPFTFADQSRQNITQKLGGGLGAQAVGFGVSAPAAIVQGIANTPQEIAKAGTDIGTDIRSSDWTMQKSIGDLAEAAMPILTIGTLGEAGAVSNFGKAGIEEAIAKGTLGGGKYGAAFGLLGGLADSATQAGAQSAVAGIGENRDTTDWGQYAGNVAKSTAMGTLLGAGAGFGIGVGGHMLGKLRVHDPVNEAIQTSVNPQATLPDSSITHEQFQQSGADLLSPSGQSAIMNNVRNAAINQPSFHDVLDASAQQLQGRALSNIKHPLTAAEKIVEHRINGDLGYGTNDVNDYLRGSVVVGDRTQIPEAIQTVKNNLEQRGYKILKTDNYFDKPGPQNYEGYHLDVQMPSGQQGEIQIHTNQSWANARLTHSVYSKYSEDVPDEMQQELDNIQGKVKNADPNQIDVASRADENLKKMTGKFVSPLESDYTGNYTNEALAKQGLANYFAKNNLIDTTDPKSDTQLGMDMLSQQRKQEAPQEQPAGPNISPTMQKPNEQLDNLTQQRDLAAQDLQTAQAQLDKIQKGQAQGKTMSVREVKTQVKQLQGNVNDLNTQIAKEQQGIRVGEQKQTTQNAIKFSQTRREAETDQTTQQATQKVAPEGGFRSGMNSIVSELNKPASERLDTSDPTAFRQLVTGAQDANDILASRSIKQLKNESDFKNLTQQQKEQVSYSISEPDLVKQWNMTPEQIALRNQIEGLNQAADPVRQASSPSYQSLKDNYGTVYVKGVEGNADPAIKEYYKATKNPLSTFSAESEHRNIQAFIASDGTGDRLIGKPGTFGSAKGLTQVGSTFEDATGKQYLPVAANMRDYESLGFKVEKDPFKIAEQYSRSTLKLKTNAEALKVIQDGKLSGQVSNTKLQGYKLVDDIPQLRGKYVSPKLKNALNKLGFQPTDNIGLQVADGLQQIIRSTILTNPIVHPLNMYVNGLLGSAEGGVGGIYNFHKNIAGAINDVLTKNDNYLAATREGIGTGGFKNGGKGIFQNALNKMFNDGDIANKIGETADTINPIRQLLRGNKAIVGTFDDVFRTSLYRSYIDKGFDPAKAQAETQHFLVDYGNTNEFEQNVVNRALIFYPWLKGNLGILGRPAANLATGQIGAIGKDIMPAVMGALIYGGLSAAQQYAQNTTGNKDAKLRMPGAIGIAQSLAEAPGQIMNKEIPQAAVSHVQPLISAGIQQATGVKRVNDIVKPGGASKMIVKPGDENKTGRVGFSGNIGPVPMGIDMNKALADRVNNAAGTLVGPYNMTTGTDQGKKTIGEDIQNYAGLNTPHLQGFSAEPNQPNANILRLPINSPNAKPTTGLEIIQGQQAGQKGWSQDDFNTLQKVQSLTGSAKYQAFADNPAFYDKYAIMKKSEAAATGQKLDPIYNYNGQDMKIYSQWKSANAKADGSGGAVAYKNPKVIQMQREQESYLSDPAVQAQFKALDESQGKTYTPYISDPMYQKASNSQIADYEKWTSLPQGSKEKTAWEANHPWTKEISVLREPYQLQQLQNQWNTRPAGQSQADFLKQHQNANFAGVDENGNIIPLRDPAHNPWLQLNSQQKMVALTYTAERTANGATDAKTKALIQANSWLPAYWNANKQYYGSTNNAGDTTGLNLSFGNSGGTGSSSGSSSYNYADQYIRRQMLAAAFRDADARIPILTTTLPLNRFQGQGGNALANAKPSRLKDIKAAPTPGKSIPMPKISTSAPKVPKISIKGLGGPSSIRQS